MYTNHSNIIIAFVPGGCPGVHQPCDVSIQRPLKLLIRKSYHEDIVHEFLSELEKGNPTPHLKDQLRILCDWSIRWMWNSYQVLSDKELVRKVNLFRRSKAVSHLP